MNTARRFVGLIGLCLILLVLFKSFSFVGRVMHYELPCIANESTHQHVRELVKTLDSLMSQADVTHWIGYGSLLGWVRRGDILPWDFDGDMSYLLKDLEKVRIFSYSLLF